MPEPLFILLIAALLGSLAWNADQRQRRKADERTIELQRRQLASQQAFPREDHWGQGK